jgi:membrane protein YdbS with pleckstrin-like domain
MFNFVIGLSISLIIHSVELVQKKFLQQAKTNPALVIPVVLIIAFGIGQLGFQSYGFNILSSLLWMSTSEMIILFGTFMKQLLSTNPKKSITYKILCKRNSSN